MAVIGTIRNKLGGLLILVIAFAMLAFILMDMGGNKNGQQARGNSIANVNGKEISYVDFDAKLKSNEQFTQQNLVQQGQLQPGQPLTEANKEMVRLSTYNEMLGDELKSEVYSNLGIRVDKAEKTAMLFEEGFIHPSILSSFRGEDGKYNPAFFQQYIQNLGTPDPNSGLTPDESRAQWANFESAIYKERADAKYNTLLSKSANVPTWMAEALYNNENTSANIEYVYLPFSDIKNEEVSTTDSELKAYIKEHATAFQQEESANLKYIVYPIVPSADDINTVQTWMNEKFAAWKKAESDSLFIMANSETKWDPTYYKSSEIVNQFSDSIFSVANGTTFGPVKNGNDFVAYKLIDKRQIPDSVKVKHIYISGEGLTSREEYLALIDSLTNLIENEGASFEDLAQQFSKDVATASNGGDLGWVQKGTQAYDYALFNSLKVGSTQAIETQVGTYIVQPYKWGTTSTGVKLATLSKTVYASEETTNNIFAEASLYSGNNRTKEAFIANSEKVKDLPNVSKTANTLPSLKGNAREIVKFAFNAESGEVSAPFMVGNNFVVALQNGKFEKGLASLENVKAIVEAEVIKEKKAEMLKAKISGKDLAAIAASNKKSVQSANGLSLANVTLANVGNEPSVAGAAVGLAVNAVSAPIVGETGVFVVKTTSKTEAPAPTDLSRYKGRSTTYASSVQGKLFNALKEAAKVEDFSFDFF